MLDEAEYKRTVLDCTPFTRFIADPTVDMGLEKVEWWTRMIDSYEQFTGVRETDWNKVFHHRIANYGDPCSNCGKPLRSPTAKDCAACGHRKAAAADASPCSGKSSVPK
jgi:hypothetical protein